MKDDKPVIKPQPITHSEGSLAAYKKRKSGPWIRVVLGAASLLIATVAVMAFMYHQALKPVDSNDSHPVITEVVSGSTPDQIASLLREKGVIRSAVAFTVHTRIHRIQNKLQAGTYTFDKKMSTQDIAAQLTKGPTAEEFEITFLPGGTLRDGKKVLLGAGYSEEEIDAAFMAQYDHPLFEGRPASSDIEGYLFGETHRFVKGASLDSVLLRFFDDFYEVIEEKNIKAAYEKQGLTLYEGITLASVVQRESGGGDEAQIAQVFLLRIDKGIQLGSDVTYQYIADKLGLERSVTLDNPYNTRRYTGLPPGPIATPGVRALQAVAEPAAGDYLYFLSGDDDTTYFAHTEAEHEKNIREHCQKKCQII